ncbi:MAG: alpha/beta hydrolase [Planctomycetota bacterium]
MKFYRAMLLLCLSLTIPLMVPTDSCAQPESKTESPFDDARRAYQNTVESLNDFNSKHSRTFQGNHVPIHYLDWNVKSNHQPIPFIFLHGTYSSAHDLVRFAPKIIQAGYHPVSIDWYGHGKTPLPTEKVSAVDFTKDLKLLTDKLGFQKVVLAGHSRGGMLASEFYRQYPNQVSGLVLIDGGSTCIANYFASLGKQGIEDWMGAMFDSAGKPKIPSFDTREDLFVATWERFGRPKDPTEMYDVISQSGQNNQGQWSRMRPELLRWLGQDNRQNTFQGMLHPDQSPEFFRSTVLIDPIKLFADLDVPILILDATGNGPHYKDSTPVQDNRRLQQLHPDLVIHQEFPTGHFLHREKPEEFVDALENFRQKLQ